MSELGLTVNAVVTGGGPAESTLKKVNAAEPVVEKSLAKLDKALSWRAGSSLGVLKSGKEPAAKLATNGKPAASGNGSPQRKASSKPAAAKRASAPAPQVSVTIPAASLDVAIMGIVQSLPKQVLLDEIGEHGAAANPTRVRPRERPQSPPTTGRNQCAQCAAG